MAMLIRSAVEEDTGPLAALHVASRRAAYRGLMPDRLLDGPDVEAERARAWRERLASPAPGARTWVAEDEGGLLGFIASGPTREPELDPGRVADVFSLYLAPARFGQGVGRALLDHTLDDLRARGFQEVVLWVLEGNARAERFYARAGFAPGKHEVKVDGGVDLPHVRWARRL